MPTGATDYKKWDKFNAKDFGIEEESPREPEPVQARKFLDRQQEIEQSRKRLAELEKEQKDLEIKMKELEQSRVKQERYFMIFGLVLFLLATFSTQFFDYYYGVGSSAGSSDASSAAAATASRNIEADADATHPSPADEAASMLEEEGDL
jgi:hypothetical protein